MVRVLSSDIDLANRPSFQSFVLVKQKNGLCKPYMVHQDQIFYIYQFRDNRGNLKERGTAWNDLVARHAIISSDKPQTAKRIQHSRARDYTKLQVGPTASFRNEILTLAASYEISNRREFLGELEGVLEYIDHDAKYAPRLNDNMHRFVDSSADTDEFLLEHAEALKEEMKICWPDVNITSANIMLIQQAMASQKLVVERRLLEPFLAREGILSHKPSSRGLWRRKSWS